MGNSAPNQPNPEADGKQELIWDAPSGIPGATHENTDDEVRFTKDIISLVDVPIASQANIKHIQVTKPGINGTSNVVQELGKVTVRMSPHPEAVLVDGVVVPRARLKENGSGSVKPIMVKTITTVLYQGGVVQPIHYDILHVFLHKLYDRWIETGSRSNKIALSKPEIASILGVKINGRVRKQMEDALQTLTGLQVITIHKAPDQDQPGHGQVGETIHRLGSIISESIVYRAPTVQTRGKPPDIIEITFNSAIMEAMTGSNKQRQWALRTRNLTQTFKFEVPWHRQAYAILDSRFQQTGYLRVPLMELWVGCIGGSAEDVQDNLKWRLARYRIVNFFKELQTSGYLMDLQMEVKRYARRRTQKTQEGVFDQESDDTEIIISLNDDSTATLKVDSPYSLEKAQEWIFCRPGPGFFQGLPQHASDFAREIAVALFGRSLAESGLESLGTEIIIEYAWGRLKKFIQLIGDRRERLPATAWLTESYPRSSQGFLLKLFMNDRTRRANQQAVGNLYETPQTVFADKRFQFVVGKIQTFVASKGINFESTFLNDQAASLKDDTIVGECIQSIQQALHAFASSEAVTKDAFDPMNREVYPELNKAYRTILIPAIEMGMAVTAHHHWFGDIEDDKDLPKPDQVDQLWRQEHKTLVQQFREAVVLITDLEMEAKGEMPQTKREFLFVLVARLKQRLLERLVEERRIDRIVTKGKT